MTFFRALPRTYWFLWLGTLINRLGNFVVPFLALYLTQERGIDVGRVGVIIAMYGAGSILAGPLGGTLADRLGRRPTILGGMVAGAGAMLVLSCAQTPGALMVATFFLGLLNDVSRPALSATIADVVPPALRARAYALQYWAINLGFSIAPAVAGAVAGYGFAPLFIADAITTLLCAVVIWRAVPETRPPDRDATAPTRLDLPYRDGAFMPLALLTVVTSMLFLQATVALPLEMRADGIAPSEYGILMALNGIIIVFLQPLTLRFVERVEKTHLLAVGALLTGLGLSLTSAAHTFGAYAMTVVVWTLGEIAMAPAGSALVAELAPTSLRGSYQGAYHLAWSAGGFLAPLASGWVLQQWGAPTLWAGCAWVGAGAALLHLAASGPRSRRLRARAAAT